MLSRICDEIEARKVSATNADKVVMELGLSHLPTLMQDNTDRNRTSPFAFTGNKFEFRAVGSSANTAFPVTVLNTAVADGMKEVIARLKAAGFTSSEGGLEKGSEKIFDVIREIIKETKAIRFEGNGYSEDWVKEAEKRGLKNLRKSPEAIKELISKTSIDALTTHKVLSEEEVHSRFNVRLERYIKNMQIEVDCLKSMVTTQVLPACYLYHGSLSQAVAAASQIGVQAPQLTPLKNLTTWITTAQEKLSVLTTLTDKAEQTHDEYKKAEIYAGEVSSSMSELRTVVDELETLVMDEMWPLPKYREMLFIS
jgi:glutamine synthetase